MLFIIVGDNKIFRKEKLGEILQPLAESELIIFDDTTGEIRDLEQFLYPSLFSTVAPVVHGQFVLSDDLPADLSKKLIASPTIFVFEELSLPSMLLTTLKKQGAVVHAGEKTKTKKAESDIFAATACITAPDKKSRWLAYRAAVEKHSIEAIIGILYWKVRTLAEKGGASNSYKHLYAKLLDAQSRAWQTGAPLEILIEKIILTQ